MTPASESEAVISPDGRWLAYVSDQTGRVQVYVRESPNGTSAGIYTEGGEEHMWSRNGPELYFRRRPGLYDVGPNGRFLVVTGTWNTELEVVFH